MPLVLGVDASTQSTKVEVRDADSGALVASASAPPPPTTPPRSEQDPGAWWSALGAAMAATGIHEVAAVAVAGQQHGLVALDGANRVLRPAKLWNDTESAPDAERLRARLEGGAAAWATATGSVPVASFTITKLAWLRREEPEVWARLARVLLPHDWLTFRLTGAFVTDRGDASGTGYWSPAEGRWRTDLLTLVDDAVDEGDWAARLPRVLGPEEPAGTLTDGAASALGLAPGTVVAAGTGDNMAAALAVGLAPGDIMVSLGTSGTVAAVTTTPTADATGAVAGFADATGHFLPLVCTLNATQVTDAFADLLGVDRRGLADLALSAPPGAAGAVVVPYFAGERTPDRPDATGTLGGLTYRVGRAEVARAAHEGVCCGLLEGLDALRAVIGPDSGDGRMVLVGGGARSRAYPQVMADLSGREITLPGGTELVATGACVQAAAVTQGRRPEEVAAAWGSGRSATVTPGRDIDTAGIRERYARHRG